MGFRAPESLKGSFTGNDGEMACSLLGLGHSPSLPVEEACASSGVRFRAPESPRGSVVGVGSGLACSSLGLRLGHSPSFPVEEACASSRVRLRVPESLKGSFIGVGSELARGRSSVEEVKSERGGLLRGRDQDLGTKAFSGEGGRGLGRSEDLVPAATGWQSWFRSRAMVLAFTRIELRDPCWDRVHLAVFPVILSWV